MQVPTSDSDPSGLYGSVVSLIGAVLALLVAFGVDLTDEQTAVILGVATAAGPIVTAVLIRRRAWAPESHQAATERAYEAGTHDNRL